MTCLRLQGVRCLYIYFSTCSGENPRREHHMTPGPWTYGEILHIILQDLYM